MAYIDQRTVEEIKLRNPIEDVISSYVTLSKSGSNMKGLCPFHSEKTPSFTVFSGSSSFYCFGCGTGGDVISFIMKAENLEYVDALEFLAKRAGVTIPEDTAEISRGVTRTRVIEMNKAAARFFRDSLFHGDAGGAARDYLVNRRGLDLAIIKRFGLGYAPASFSVLRDHLRKEGFTDEEMLEASLCGKSEKTGKLYDIFRNRVMFPIIDVAGNVVAFSGRALDDSPAKYLNSKDTPAFKKSRVVFALNYAKNECQNGLILCEGNVDVVSLHQAGFENAVATLGTAITPEHARIMKKYTSKVFIAYDGDAAGMKATEKAVKTLGDVGIESKVIVISGAKDPDEFIKKYGRLAFEKLMDESRSVFDYRVESVLKKYDIKNADDKAKAARELCDECARMPSKIEREIFTAKIAKALSVDEKSVKYDVEKSERSISRQQKKSGHRELVMKTSGLADRINRDFAKNPRVARLEEIVLGMMLYCPELLSKALERKMISEDDFFTEYSKKLFGVMKTESEKGVFDISSLNEALTSDEVSRAVKLMAARDRLSNSDEIFFRTLTELKEEISKKKDVALDDLVEKINRARQGGN